VVKVIWHKATSPLQPDGSIVFARWRQCALPSGHIGAKWRIRLNLCFFLLTQVHNPNSKSIGSAVFLYFTVGCPFPSKLPFTMRDVEPHLIHGFLGPAESSTQMTSGLLLSYLHPSPNLPSSILSTPSISPFLFSPSVHSFPSTPPKGNWTTRGLDISRTGQLSD